MSAAVLRSKSVTVVGLGNIGSQLCDLIARMADVGRITLIDKDSYEPWNLTSQQLFRSEVGKPKVAVQCRRLKQIRPDLAIEPIHNDVRYVPLGKLRADVVCTCLDSRIARQHVNEAVWRLGTPWWIDAGVRADGMLVRVNLYSPAYGGPCLECGWGPQDYELIEQVYPCGQGRRTSPTDGPASLEELVAALQAIECRKDTGIFPTDAPASLGALAAALQAIECRKALEGVLDATAAGRQILIDASANKHYVSSVRRNPHCRFDHDVWQIRKLGLDPAALTPADLLAKAAEDGVGAGGKLVLDNRPFVRAVCCPSCGARKKLLRVADQLHPRELACRCGAAMTVSGVDLVRELDPGEVGGVAKTLRLGRLGLCSGDVVTIRSGPVRLHYEL